jgi:hypothetical protein
MGPLGHSGKGFVRRQHVSRTLGEEREGTVLLLEEKT